MSVSDYKEKLEAFFALVPETKSPTMINQVTGVEYYGEVLSGSPIIPVKGKEGLAVAKEAIEKASVSDNPVFTTLTGLTHRRLLDSWKDGGLLTSCNAFVMKAGQAVGVRGLGGFDVEQTLGSLGLRHCWIRPSSGEVPQFGDIFETRSRTPGSSYENLHVGISIAVKGTDWFTIEGGQGGPGSGVDRVARLKRKYDTSHLLGWVDIRLLASGKAAYPDWLIGNLMIYCGSQNFIYSFNHYGEATQKAYRPAPGQNGETPSLDQGSIFAIAGDKVTICWDREGGFEEFTYDRWNSFSGLNEKMNGVAADGSAMLGIRL